MKKIIITALVGALIVFIYQSMSWMFLGLHANSTKAAVNNEEVMTALNANMKETAVYDIPFWDMKATPEEGEKLMNEWKGKPYARVIYHTSMDMGTAMGKQMTTGFVLNFFAGLFVALIISTGAFKTFASRFMVPVYMCLFVIVTNILMEWNWWATPMSYLSGEIIDYIIISILTGLWVAWYWGRGDAKAS